LAGAVDSLSLVTPSLLTHYGLPTVVFTVERLDIRREEPPVALWQLSYCLDREQADGRRFFVARSARQAPVLSSSAEET